MDFTVKTNVGGVITNISRADGSELEIDGEQQEYLDFLGWAAKQNPCIARSYEWLDARHLYFNLANKSKLTDYCKNNGTMLFTARIEGAGKPPRLIWQSRCVLNHVKRGMPAGTTLDAAFLQLQEAQTAPPNDDWDRVAGITPVALPIWVTEGLFEQLNKELLDEESEIRKLSSWLVEKTFVYFDVSGFSRDHRAGQQALILNSIIRVINDERWWRHRMSDVHDDCESSLCIGDGYIFVFRRAHLAAYFAAYLANLVEHLIAEKRLPEFHFRVGVHRGPVYRFWDISPQRDGKWNYVGQGITDAERVLNAAGKEKDDVVYISAETREAILSVHELPSAYQIAPWLQNRGRLPDKHGDFRRIYEVNHSAWMSEARYAGDPNTW